MALLMSSNSCSNSFDLSAKLVWNPTGVLTVTGEATRETEESTTPGESGVLTTTLKTRVDKFKTLFDQTHRAATAGFLQQLQGCSWTICLVFSHGLLLEHR